MFASKDTLLTRPSGGYTIGKSVRLRSSATAYLNRTPATPTNNKIWTWSGWVKRGTLSTASGQVLMEAYAGGASLLATLAFSSNGAFDRLELQSGIAGVSSEFYQQSVAVYRDPSAWYHVMCVYDSTQTTASNRVKLYINGVQLTTTAYATYNQYPSQNYVSGINTAILHKIGTGAAAGNYDGYLTEINFIDGQALTPSSFGSTNAITGVWQPAKYTGTYGTNGFYLNFSDNSNNTATTIGKDYSGNGNNWTPNNISVTAGVTYDSMTDVPTLTSATAANYPVWNPLDKGTSSGSTSNANLNCNPNTSTSVYGMTTTMEIPITGKYYFELLIGSTGGSGQAVVCLTPQAINSVANGGYNNTGCFAWVLPNNEIRLSGSAVTTGVSFSANDVIGVTVNNGIIAFYKNNTLIYTYSTNMSSFTGSYVAMFSGSSNASASINFGQQPFTYTPPTGYVALNTYNLPTSTITNGAAYMAATLYTGNGSTQSVSNAVNGISFQPDLVWAKTRVVASSNALFDSVRGATKVLISNSTVAETNLATNGVTAFNSGGFSVTDDSAGDYYVNGASGGTYSGTPPNYVAWQWKAGTTSSSNTNGSITSTVSVGATQGFSVVTYTGNGILNATIGHGLGVAPSMVIIKNRVGANNWDIYHISNGAQKYMDFTTAGVNSLAIIFPTTPTSSVVYLGTTGGQNTISTAYVAYCFAAVAGYSAFGSYTGNGSTDGPFVYCGFRPRFILVKSSSGAFDWHITDTSRSPYNQADTVLFPNSSATETSGGGYYYDLLSNGFKCRNLGSATNGSGATYIFAAFAESPFKTSLAR